MPEARSAAAQLTTARLILAQGLQQIAEYEATGAHADRIDGLRDLKTTWTKRVADLEAQVKAGR